MRDKIEQAKQQLGLSDKELSVKLGYGERYIARKLKTPPTDKTQELIIHRIEKLLGESELNAIKKELEHKNQVLDKRNDLLANAQYEIESMEKTLKEIKRENQTLGISLMSKDARIKKLKKQITNERITFLILWAVGLLILVGWGFAK